MIPTIGRSVHYVLPDGVKNKGHHRAATISQVWTEEATEKTQVQLYVIPDGVNDGENGPYYVRNASQDSEEMKPGTWHEPERAKIPGKETPAQKKELVHA